MQSPPVLSNPTTLTSPGTRTPRIASASQRPLAAQPLEKTIAVGPAPSTGQTACNAITISGGDCSGIETFSMGVSPRKTRARSNTYSACR